MVNRRFHRIKLLVIIVTGLFTSLCASAPLVRAQDNDEAELFLVAQKAFEDGFYDVSMRYINQLFEENPKTEKHIQAKLLLGQCYFFKSQYLKAYDTFEGLLKYNEYKDATLYWLGETYLKGSDYKNAEKQYTQLIDLYPDSIYTPQAHYSLGWTYFSQNKFKKAKKAFLKLIRKFPIHHLAEDSSFKLAETEYNIHAYENAIQYFKSYVLNYPKSRRHAQAYFYIAESYYFRENYLTAVTYYAKTAEIAYDNKLILMGKTSLGWSYLKLEKFKLAQQYFNDAYQFAKEKNILSDDVLLGQATFYAEMGNHNEALKAYKQLIKKFPDSGRIIEATLGLANTYYQTKNYVQAIKSYRVIINASLDDKAQEKILEKAYFGLAWAHLKSGDIDSAVESFETIKNSTASKIVKISALTQIGDAYQDVGQFQKAISFYDKVLRDFADSPYTDYVQYRQGIALLKMEEIEAATLSFQSLQANFPTSKYLNDIKYYLAVAYFKKEDWKTARAHIHEFIDGLPQSNKFLAEANYILALSNFNLKEYKEAIRIFQIILKDFSQEKALVKNAELYIAKSNYEMNSIADALKKFQVIVDTYPKSKVAQEALMWLGDHHLEDSDFDSAIVYYKKFIDMFPGSQSLNLIYYELGRAYQAKGEYDQAVAAFKHIDDSQDRELLEKTKLAIADIFSRDLDPKAAIQTYQNIIDSSPEFKRNAYIKIAKINTKMKNYEGAISAYKSALKSKITSEDYSNAELQFLVADAHQLVNNHEAAVEEYLKVSYLYSKNVNWVIKAYLRIARIFEDDDQWENARITYKKVLVFDVDEAKFAQERLDWISEHIQP